MKRKFIILSNVVITFILSLFGVGCESDENNDPNGDMSLAYGTPTAYYSSVKGTVTGVNNAKVVGIEVTIGAEVTRHGEKIQYMIDTTQTDSLGKYAFKIYGLPRDSTEYTLSFKDIDEEENGSYIDIDKTSEITISASEFDKETGTWNKEVNVQLVTKKEDDEL